METGTVLKKQQPWFPLNSFSKLRISNSRITEEQCRYNKTCSTCRLDVEDEFHFSVICP